MSCGRAALELALDLPGKSNAMEVVPQFDLAAPSLTRHVAV